LRELNKIRYIIKISRIKEIINIGTFANFTNGGSLGFEKLTFIYGLNTFGKSTLADIFQSLKINNGSIILRRKTIPEIISAQKVKLAIKENPSEKEYIFQNDSWDNNINPNHLEVFGADFISNNVFTGLTIERQNRENFTNFILGDQGAKLAKNIKDKKKDLGDKKRLLKEKIPQYVKNSSEEDIKKFIEFSPAEIDKEEVNKKIVEKKSVLQQEKERIKEPTKIINMEEPSLFVVPKINLAESINTINELLERNYSDIKKESIELLNKHVTNNFSNFDNSKKWIQQGLEFCKDKKNGNCPFCSQELKNVKELINLYESYFNKSYTNFIDETTDGLNININILKNSRFNSRPVLQTALLKINLYENLITEEGFKTNLQKLTNVIENLKEIELEKEKDKLALLFENKITEKIKNPYEEIKGLEYSNLEKIINDYKNNLKQCENLFNILLSEIKKFKKQYQNLATVQQSIRNMEDEISKLEFRKARIEQDEECKEFKKLADSIHELSDGENGIKKLEKKLQEDQTNFLKKYFENINNLFSKFGSKNFTLKKEEDNTGHLPVYSLKVEFHNKEIPNEQLRTIFSESDRRALALAIFFAKIELKEEEDKRKTIIVLDDPITSFDDNRTTNSINFFKNILDKSSQLIILTHYIHFIKRFCEITKGNHITTKFFNIQQNSYTSYLDEAKREEFISTEYEKTFMKIYGYINKKHSNCIKADLRPFLESYYLPIVFSKQIHDKNVDCSNLENMINGLFNQNNTIKNKFHELRNTLNPDSHIFTSNNPEDVRNFAKDMFDFIYSVELVGINKN